MEKYYPTNRLNPVELVEIYSCEGLQTDFIANDQSQTNPAARTVLLSLVSIQS